MSKDYFNMTKEEFAAEIKDILCSNNKETAEKKITEIHKAFLTKKENDTNNTLKYGKFIDPAEFAKFAKKTMDANKKNHDETMNFLETQNLIRAANGIEPKTIPTEAQINEFDDGLEDEKKMDIEQAQNLVRQYNNIPQRG